MQGLVGLCSLHTYAMNSFGGLDPPLNVAWMCSDSFCGFQVNNSTILGASGDYADYQYLKQVIEQMV